MSIDARCNGVLPGHLLPALLRGRGRARFVQPCIRLFGILASLLAALIFAASASAQRAVVEVNTDRNNLGFRRVVLDGAYIIAEFDWSSGAGTVRVVVSDLDASKLDAVVNGGSATSFSLYCQGERECIQEIDSSPEQKTWMVWYFDVYCASASDCQSFAKAVRDAIASISSGGPTGSSQVTSAEDASTYRASSRRSARSSKPADEPVIDGSRIPSQINFNKDDSSVSKPVVKDMPKPSFDDLGREYLGSKSTAASDGNENLSSRFDSLAKQPPVTYESQIRNESPTDSYAEVEKYGAGLFDDARKAPLETFTGALKSVARQWLSDLYDDLSRNTMSRSLTGQSFDELPEAFRKDYSVWEAGVHRIFEPFSLKGGLELVDKFGSLFDLWREQ